MTKLIVSVYKVALTTCCCTSKTTTDYQQQIEDPTQTVGKPHSNCWEKKNRAAVLVAVALSQFLSGLATCVGYAWLSGDQPRRLLFTWPLRGVSAPAGSAGHARALVVLPHLLPPSSGFQLSGVRPRVPLLPPFLSSCLLATWGFSSSCSIAVSSGAAAAGPGQDPISAHAAHLNLPPSASPPSADHPCGSALLTAWPRGGHSPGLDTGFVHSSFSHAFSSSPSSLAHLSPAALNCSRLFSGPSLRVSFNLASWGA